MAMWFLWPSTVRWRSRLGRQPARRARGKSNRKGLESVGEGRSIGEEAAVTLLYTTGAEGSSDSVKGGGRSRCDRGGLGCGEEGFGCGRQRCPGGNGCGYVREKSTMR
ncbi:hypothetical protein BHE74_00026432 [Ensete ventricosum]|nr:hypothetical protein BHE74_00026432 [Ensete ventricosum]